ncbi:MAG: MarR family transcriptional regulator [Meiothermus sp.]
MPELTAQGNAFTELVLEVFRLHGLILRDGDAIARPVGLTSARWQILGVVEHGAIPVASVARLMGLSRQSVQQTADALEREGFTEYAENVRHLRAKLVDVTEKGREALRFVAERQAEWANEIGGKHELEDLQTALRVLRELRESLEPQSTKAKAGRKNMEVKE